ncbi:MAG: membrane protein FxsA [Deltaproteobacteria bacterium]|nr:membrane protein FxsA [Deltaproteobacteria bacterium]MBW2136091.1 membrane protein FxsA [Deltaproteobacteria bacterium]
MLLKLFLLFTIIPFLEIYVLIEVGRYVGALNTVAIVILTGFLGAYLARLQGISTLHRVRVALDRGEIPAEEMLDALLILIAGIVLLTPGFLTDTFGILLLIPQTRAAIKGWLRQKIVRWIEKNRVDIHL